MQTGTPGSFRVRANHRSPQTGNAVRKRRRSTLAEVNRNAARRTKAEICITTEYSDKYTRVYNSSSFLADPHKNTTSIPIPQKPRLFYRSIFDTAILCIKIRLCRFAEP